MHYFPSKNLLLFCFAIILSLHGLGQISQKWTDSEIKRANTVEGCEYLDNIEKEAVIILNLARLYPKKFVMYEVENFNGTERYGNYIAGSKYKESLIKEMNQMSAMPPLYPHLKMTQNANCFALEAGKSGYVGHERKKCKAENYAECCSFGMVSGREIILQLLIDHDVPSMGHRAILFTRGYSKIGLSNESQTVWNEICVLEII